jgi:adenosylmethionine-8-amino-7-oxononanoate aminotransferase
LREKQIVVAVEGKNRNVVYLMPPLCFTKANAIAFVEALDDIIYELGPEDLEVKVTQYPVNYINCNNK